MNLEPCEIMDYISRAQIVTSLPPIFPTQELGKREYLLRNFITFSVSC